MQIKFILSIAILIISCHLVQAIPLERRDIDSCYKKGKAKLTFYWIPKEGEEDMDNNGKVFSLTGAKIKTLRDKDGKVIANVCKKTKQKIRMEGTGLLTNGKLINLGTHDNEFMVLDRKKTPYGIGASGRALAPWVSVAVNDIKIGTTLYIKELDGVKLPSGEKHNGCVRVDDNGWSMGGCHVDFFSLQYKSYKDMTKVVPKEITVTEESCKVKDYTTSSIKKWAEL